MATNSRVIERMSTLIEQFEANQDHRVIFLSCYQMMTQNMLIAIDEGRFNDGDWVRELLHRFAEYYFDGIDEYESNPELQSVWTDVHNSTATKELHVLQHLLLGVNAHINYDLVLTLYDMLSPEWDSLNEQQRKNRYDDHCLVNEIIGATIDRVQDEVVEKYAPSMNIVDRMFGRLDEVILLKFIKKWRKDVWDHNQQLLALEKEDERSEYKRELQHQVMRRTDWLDTETWFS